MTKNPSRLCAGLLALTLSACETSSMSDRQIAGMVLGGALGGLAGSQFGEDMGKMAMTGLGIALGAYLGSEIGRSMDDNDRRYHDEAARTGLWDHPSGRPSQWRNPSSGVQGEFVPGGAAFVDNRGRTCRRFTDRVTFSDGVRREVEGTACLNRAGEWVISRQG